jgi:transcriptional regulator with XRE-family HTH domain
MTGAELRALREAHGLTQAALARALHVPRQTVYRYEHGRRISAPMAELIRRVLKDAEAKGQT